MTGGAAQSVLRFRSVDLFLDRAIEPAVEENRVIVTAGAPLRGLCADDVLHILDRFSVPLIVERPEVMRRAVELIVDFFVTASAFLAGHEKRRRNRAPNVSLRRGGKERTVRS